MSRQQEAGSFPSLDDKATEAQASLILNDYAWMQNPRDPLASPAEGQAVRVAAYRSFRKQMGYEFDWDTATKGDAMKMIDLMKAIKAGNK